MTTKTQISVAVINSSPLYLEGYIQLLSYSNSINLHSADQSAEKLFSSLTTAIPDVIITSIESADWDASYLLERIQLTHPTIKLIVNGDSNPIPLIKLLLQKGAASYFLQTEVTKFDLERIILESHQFGYARSRTVSKELLNECRLNEKTTRNKQLSERELQILLLTCQGQDRKSISADTNIAESTVKFHLDKLRQKFNCRSVLQLAVFAIKEGVVKV